MRKDSMLVLMALCLLAAAPRVVAAEETGATSNITASVVQPARGHVSSPEQKAARAAKLRARIKAIEEGKNRSSTTEKTVVPIGHRSVRGSEQIKKKMEAAKESGKKGTAKLKGYFSGLLGSLQKFSDTLSSYEDKGRISARKKERKMSFKERLKIELEKKRQRNNARK